MQLRSCPSIHGVRSSLYRLLVFQEIPLAVFLSLSCNQMESIYRHETRNLSRGSPLMNLKVKARRDHALEQAHRFGRGAQQTITGVNESTHNDGIRIEMFFLTDERCNGHQRRKDFSTFQELDTLHPCPVPPGLTQTQFAYQLGASCRTSERQQHVKDLTSRVVYRDQQPRSHGVKLSHLSHSCCAS